MLIYFTVDFSIAFFGFLLLDKNIKLRKKCIDIYFFLILALLIFVSAFRGDFNSDYVGYESMYQRFSSITLQEIFKRDILVYPEKGYLLFQYVIKHVFHDVIWVFIITSIIIVISNAHQIKKYSPNLLLGFILFVEVGTYYTSFNLVRNVLAISIVMMGSSYLYEKKTFKYFICVTVAGLIHSSAFFMLPMYFLLNIKLKKKSIVIYVIIFLILVVSLPVIIHVIQNYYWSWYFTSDSIYGNGYTWKSVFIPFLMDSFSIGAYFVRYKKINLDQGLIYVEEKAGVLQDNIENVWLNATFYHLMLSLLGLQVSIISRFTEFFSLFSILFFCRQVEKNKYKKIIIVGVVILATLFCMVTRNDYPYYFIWNR